VDGKLPLDAAAGVKEMPMVQRPMVDIARVRALDPMSLRAYIGDGNYGGLYQRSDEDMLALWKVAVDETRALLTGSWGDAA
jgi:creatinine amidohydrolase